MEVTRTKAEEIRALARNFTDAAERTALAEYRQKLLLAAVSLTEAASALEESLHSSAS